MRMRQKERWTIRTDKRKYTYPPFTFLALKEQEQKANERSGPIEPAEVGRQGSVGSLEGIRKAKVCRSKVDTEAHGGVRGRSVLERPKNRKSREGRKQELVKGDEMKVRARTGTGTKGRKQERCRIGYREGIREAEGEPEVPKRKTEDRKAGMSESSAEAETPRSEKGKWKVHISRPRTVEALHDQTIRRKSRMGEGKEVKMGSLPYRRVRTRVRDHASRNWTKGRNVERDQGNSIKAENDSAEGQDQRWRTRIGEWNEKSRSLKDQYSISEARRFGVGVAATSGAVAETSADTSDTPDEVQTGCSPAEGPWPRAWTRNSETGGRENECKLVQRSGRADGMEEAARGMGNRNNEKGRNLREVHGEDPMGRTTWRESSTCLETTNSDSSEPRFGSEVSEVGRCVRNRKSSAESVVGMRNLEVGSRIRNDKGEDRRMTAQEVLVQSESANNSSEEKSESSEKHRNLRKPEYSGLLARIEPEGSTGERREARRARDSTAGEKRLPECNGTGGRFKHTRVQRSREPKHLTNQSREATAKTEANARMFGRVPMARAAEAEHDRKESPNGESPEGDDG
ncbi:hypothetical protein DFH06DRAFT_1150847 [Mycena polygramma]|nr:hypothetical protein DFH06DRAFT_1150847 [Mycena polygramma]